MKLLIEIPEEVYEHYKNTPLMGTPDAICWPDEIKKAVRKATPIPDNATNGDAIKALYPNKTFFNEASCCVTMRDYRKTEEDAEYLTYIDFDGDWWDAPYKGGE